MGAETTHRAKATWAATADLKAPKVSCSITLAGRSSQSFSQQVLSSTVVFCTFGFSFENNTTLCFTRDSLCEPLDKDNVNDVATFASDLSGNFAGVVQYNKDNRAFEVF